MQRATVVLGGGGMKGMAHVGAWKAIEEAGFEVREVIGTSIGSLVGGCIAAGQGWTELAPRALALQRADIVMLNRWAVLWNGIRQTSVFRAERFRRYIEAVLPVGRFDGLTLPLSMNAVDLETGRMEWFGTAGRTDVTLADAVYASCAVPLFFPPAEIDRRYYVDGGVGDALPVARAFDRGADLVIAVDVAAGGAKDPNDTIAKGMIAVHHRVYDIMASQRRRTRMAELAASRPLIYVRPRLDGYSMFDFARTKYFLEEGYRATKRRLAEWSQKRGGAIEPETVAAD